MTTLGGGWTVGQQDISTVNVVIFAGGECDGNVGKAFQVGVIFTILLLFPSQRHNGFYFRVGVIFAKKS